MAKIVSQFIYSVIFIILVIPLIFPHQTAEAASNQADTITTTFTIRGGNLNDASDANGKPILKPEQRYGINAIDLKPTLNGRTAELPVGTTILLDFRMRPEKISIHNPLFPGGKVVDYKKGDYYGPAVAVLQVVGQGTATITVTSKIGLVQNHATFSGMTRCGS
jgi:hypothetical protein